MTRKALAVLPLVLALILAGLPGPASAELGAGSTLRVESQTQMLFQTGGGYINWEISGPVVRDVRRIIDERFGNGDGNITQNEGTAYVGEVDLILENYIFYGCARIVRTALLNKDINTDTSGLLVAVNSSRAIEIHFTFNANLRNDGATVDFGDQRIPLSVFRALGDGTDQTFEGKLDWRHTEIMVGLGSFSNVQPDRGEFSRFRAPGAEVLWYHLAVQNQTSSDRARFDTFSVLQCPLELFVVICVFGVFTLWFPRHFMRAKKMRKVRWLHWLALLLVAAALSLFFTGVDGLALWAASPGFMALCFILAYGIYSRGWKCIARPSAPAIPSRATAAAAPPADFGAAGDAPPFQTGAPAARWEDLPEPVHGPRSGPAAPPGPAKAPQNIVQQPDGVPTVVSVMRDLRCPRCKATFHICDPLTRPLAIKCTSCGAEGVLRK